MAMAISIRISDGIGISFGIFTKISVGTENNAEMVVTSGVENVECSSELVLTQAARL